MGDKQIVNGQLTPIGDISDFADIANAVWYLGSDLYKKCHRCGTDRGWRHECPVVSPETLRVEETSDGARHIIWGKSENTAECLKQTKRRGTIFPVYGSVGSILARISKFVFLYLEIHLECIY